MKGLRHVPESVLYSLLSRVAPDSSACTRERSSISREESTQIQGKERAHIFTQARLPQINVEMAGLEVLQNMKAKIEKMVVEVQEAQKEMGVAVQGFQGLQSQLTENKLVKEELDQLEEGAKVYKLVGPVLIPQEADEAKNTVQTRIDFISKELQAASARVEKVEKEQQSKRMTLLAEQQKFQTLVQQSAAAKQ